MNLKEYGDIMKIEIREDLIDYKVVGVSWYNKIFSYELELVKNNEQYPKKIFLKFEI